MCAEDELGETARHLTAMNRNAQLELVKYDKHWRLPYYDKIEFDDSGYLRPPPGDHRLSDALVFLIVGQNVVAARNRHGRWPADFDSAGDISPSRWPMGHPVVIWAHGMPFIPVYADYYALVGSRLRKYMWLVTTKTSHAKLRHNGWQLGEIAVSPRNIAEPSETTAFSVDLDTYDWSKFSPVPTFNCATRRYILALPTCVLTRPTNVRDFHPYTGPSGNNTACRPSDIDERTWANRLTSPYQRGNSLALVDRRVVTRVVVSTWRRPVNPDPAGTPRQIEDNTTPVPANDGSVSLPTVNPPAVAPTNSVPVPPTNLSPTNPTDPTPMHHTITTPEQAQTHPIATGQPGPVQARDADTGRPRTIDLTTDEPTRHPETHIVIDDRQSPPPDLPERDDVPPQQSPSSASRSDTMNSATTMEIRRMFGSFSPDLINDCDAIDAIAMKRTAIEHIEAELATPAAKRILQMNDELVDRHQEYTDMVSRMNECLHDREEWQKCILKKALHAARKDDNINDEEDGDVFS